MKKRMLIIAFAMITSVIVINSQDVWYCTKAAPAGGKIARPTLPWTGQLAKGPQGSRVTDQAGNTYVCEKVNINQKTDTGEQEFALGTYRWVSNGNKAQLIVAEKQTPTRRYQFPNTQFLYVGNFGPGNRIIEDEYHKVPFQPVDLTRSDASKQIGNKGMFEIQK